MIRSFFKYGVFRSISKLVLGLFLSITAANAEPVKIVALGDSLTAGYGLATHEGFVPRLQAWLEAQGAQAQIVNAGVSGDTTAGGLERVNWVLAGGADGMIVALGGNDMLRGFPPELTQDNLAKIIEAATAKDIDVLLVGVEASQNYGTTYKAQFDAIYRTLAETYDVPLYENFLAPIARDRTLEEMRPLMQADGLHPNAEGVQVIVNGMGPSVMRLIEGM
jgi:acyl-CoA thioesterase-1